MISTTEYFSKKDERKDFKFDRELIPKVRKKSPLGNDVVFCLFSPFIGHIYLIAFSALAYRCKMPHIALMLPPELLSEFEKNLCKQ